jgi:hypothetical protein
VRCEGADEVAPVGGDDAHLLWRGKPLASRSLIVGSGVMLEAGRALTVGIAVQRHGCGWVRVGDRPMERWPDGRSNTGDGVAVVSLVPCSAASRVSLVGHSERVSGVVVDVVSLIRAACTS